MPKSFSQYRKSNGEVSAADLAAGNVDLSNITVAGKGKENAIRPLAKRPAKKRPDVQVGTGSNADGPRPAPKPSYTPDRAKAKAATVKPKPAAARPKAFNSGAAAKFKGPRVFTDANGKQKPTKSWREFLASRGQKVESKGMAAKGVPRRLSRGLLSRS